MKLCVVSFKECWPDESGTWWSTGGFPLQMTAVASLFEDATLVVCLGPRQAGGIPLPRAARIVPLPVPVGVDLRRKISVLVRAPYYVARIARAIRRAHVVHTPLPGDLPLLGMFLALAMRKRLIVRYCGSWAAGSQTSTMNRVTRFCMRLFAGGRSVMLATGVGDVPPANGMSWIFATGLTRRELDQIDARVERLPGVPFRVVYAGRLSPEKGVATLVRAIAQLRADGFKPTVSLAGDGPERQSLEQLAGDLGCADQIVFLGQLDRATLSEHLRLADVCVQPSLTEGFSKAWLDAFAHGLPVLSSEVGAARAVIGTGGERGWLVPPGDARTLADVLRSIMAGPIDWGALRGRCRAYTETLTLDAWAGEIGKRCAQQWGVQLTNGVLCD